MDTFTEEQIRSFRPIIVFHDSPSSHRLPPFRQEQQHHQQNEVSTLYSKATSTNSYVESHKQRINDMLEANSKIWTNLIHDTRQWETTTQSIYHPPPSSTSISSDEVPIISPTASTSTSSSTSGSSTSSSSLSSISSSLPSAMHSSSPSFQGLPSINKCYQSQSHWKKHKYHQQQPSLIPVSQFTRSALSLEQQDSHQDQQQQQHQHQQQQQQQHLQYQMHIDTLCLDHLDKRRRGNLPKPVTAILKKWLLEHCRNPYPTEEEKLQLKNDTHLTLNQISNWFINARRRTLPIILAKLNHQYPGIKARRRRRRQRQDKPKPGHHSLNMTSPTNPLLG
ncbi:unnamed protein product [Absidia cylindrospora]